MDYQQTAHALAAALHVGAPIGTAETRSPSRGDRRVYAKLGATDGRQPPNRKESEMTDADREDIHLRLGTDNPTVKDLLYEAGFQIRKNRPALAQTCLDMIAELLGVST